MLYVAIITCITLPGTSLSAMQTYTPAHPEWQKWVQVTSSVFISSPMNPTLNKIISVTDNTSVYDIKKIFANKKTPIEQQSLNVLWNTPHSFGDHRFKDRSGPLPNNLLIKEAMNYYNTFTFQIWLPVLQKKNT